MIAFQKNRPVLQVGPCQVADYDLSWLEEAVERAAKAADFANFPMTAEVCQGVEFYLEQKCSLRLLQLEDLFARLKKLLVQVGCEPIAEHLRPLAPPITLSLVPSATLAGHGFELAFFEHLRESLTSLSKVCYLGQLPEVRMHIVYLIMVILPMLLTIWILHHPFL